MSVMDTLKQVQELRNEIERNNIIIGNYLKTIQENNEKFSELYGVIEGLEGEIEKLKCCGNCKLQMRGGCCLYGLY